MDNKINNKLPQYIGKFDEEHSTWNNMWLYNDDTYTSLLDCFGDLVRTSLIYRYELKGRVKNDFVLHTHSFEDLIKEVYNYPESFYIPEEYICDYSKQELEFINKLVVYFRNVNLKNRDI